MARSTLLGLGMTSMGFGTALFLTKMKSSLDRVDVESTMISNVAVFVGMLGLTHMVRGFYGNALTRNDAWQALLVNLGVFLAPLSWGLFALSLAGQLQVGLADRGSYAGYWGTIVIVFGGIGGYGWMIIRESYGRLKSPMEKKSEGQN